MDTSCRKVQLVGPFSGGGIQRRWAAIINMAEPFGRNEDRDRQGIAIYAAVSNHLVTKIKETGSFTDYNTFTAATVLSAG
jgi:hypothetical protein